MKIVPNKKKPQNMKKSTKKKLVKLFCILSFCIILKVMDSSFPTSQAVGLEIVKLLVGASVIGLTLSLLGNRENQTEE